MIIEDLLGDLLSQIEAEDLDDLVHDAKSNEAAQINNGGLEVQLDFLREKYGDRELVQTIKDIVKNKENAA